MKHLEKLFKEEISNDTNMYIENGVLRIRTRFWTADEIIELARSGDGKNHVFKEIFDDWLQDYTLERLEIANEILKNHDQQDRFSMIVKAHQSQRLIPFVGAGLSMPSGYVGWTNFLRIKLKQTRISPADFDALLLSGQYEEAAQQLADALGLAFNEAVGTMFGVEKEISGAVQLLPHIFSEVAITTNFDNVLERCYKSADKPFAEKLCGYDSEEIRKLLATDTRLLVRLHGRATSSTGRVLTSSEYNIHYTAANPLVRTIKTLCDSNHLLFMGCSLTVDRILATLKDYAHQEGHNNLPIHYAFLAEPNTDDERIERQQELALCHIYPIWYPQGTHDESIEALLIKLREVSL